MSIYRSVEGVNREITSITRSVNGVNRPIKEVQRCVSGVNRKVYSDSAYKLYKVIDFSIDTDKYSKVTSSNMNVGSLTTINGKTGLTFTSTSASADHKAIYKLTPGFNLRTAEIKKIEYSVYVPNTAWTDDILILIDANSGNDENDFQTLFVNLTREGTNDMRFYENTYSLTTGVNFCKETLGWRTISFELVDGGCKYSVYLGNTLLGTYFCQQATYFPNESTVYLHVNLENANKNLSLYLSDIKFYT